MWSITCLCGFLNVIILHSIFSCFCECNTHYNFRSYQLDGNLELELKDFETYIVCYRKPHLYELPQYIFSEVSVRINFTNFVDSDQNLLSANTLKVMIGSSYESITERLSRYNVGTHESDKLTSFLFSFLPIGSKKFENQPLVMDSGGVSFVLPPIRDPCFAIYDFNCPNSERSILNISTTHKLDQKRIFQSIMGIFILLGASEFANSTIFYYLLGVGIIVCSSFMLLTIFIIKLLPMRRTGTLIQGLAFLLGGGLSLLILFMDYFRSAVMHVFASNTEFVFGYVFIVSLFSLILMYWLQLPDKLIRNYPRTMIVFTIVLRLLGSYLIIYSMCLPEIKCSDSLISIFSSSVDIEQFPFTIEMIRKFSDHFVRIGLIAGLVMFTVFLQFIFSPPKNSNKCIDNQTHMSPVMHFPTKCLSSCIAGSPWASSSPCHCSLYKNGAEIASKNHLKAEYSHEKRWLQNAHSAYIPELAYSQQRRIIRPPDNEDSDENKILTDDDDD